jgi:antitoxin component of MazEF toxin-antitoxin module
MKMHATAAEAIEASIARNEITRCERTDANIEDLLVLCDDSTDSNDESEYWGSDDEGNEWRVHVALA